MDKGQKCPSQWLHCGFNPQAGEWASVQLWEVCGRFTKDLYRDFQVMTLGYIRMQKMFRGYWKKFCEFLSGFNRKEWKGERIMTLNREYRSHLPSWSQRVRAKSVHPCCFCGGFFHGACILGGHQGLLLGLLLGITPDMTWAIIWNQRRELGLPVNVRQSPYTMSYLWISSCPDSG